MIGWAHRLPTFCQTSSWGAA